MNSIDDFLLLIKRIFKIRFPFLVPPILTCKSIVRHQLSKRYIKRLLNGKNKICIEVGAGDKKGKNGWITIDVTRNCDIFWDLRKGLPFPEGKISKIYSSHFFEHLSFRESQKFLDECKRVLVPGGLFSICVPNARLYIEAYIKSDLSLRNRMLGYKPAYNNTTKIDLINFTAYMDGHHKYMFDEENLIYILESKGFKNVHLRKFDPTLDLEIRDFESIYAEAEK